MYESKASRSVVTIPASTMAWAMWGRAIRSSPAISRTRSKERSYPSAWSFSTIISPRRKRVSCRRRSSVRSPSWVASTQYPSTWSEAPSCSADSSTPGTIRRSEPDAASSASPHPSIVSWSVTAIPSNPRSRASATFSDGVAVPSEKVECVWRSYPGMAGKGGRRASRPSSGWRGSHVLARDIRNAGAPAEGHRVLELVAEDPEDVDDPVLTAGRQPPGSRSSDHDGGRPERKRLHDVRPPPNAPVDQDGDPPADRLDHLRQRVERCGAGVELPAAVVRHHDPIGAGRRRQLGILRGEDPLEQQRQARRVLADPRDVVPADRGVVREVVGGERDRGLVADPGLAVAEAVRVQIDRPHERGVAGGGDPPEHLGR